jgi:predicted Zn-dependent protease
VSKLEGAGDIPEWQSTHPNPGNRVEATMARVDTLSVPLDKLTLKRDEYLPIVAGMTYGEDPRQGYVEGNTFYHAGLRFKMELPAGWQSQNSPEALVAISPEQDAMVRLTAGQAAPEEAAKQFLGQEGVKSSDISSAPVNGMPAASGQFEAQTEQGPVQGIVSFIKYGELTYQILGYTPGGKYATYDKTFRSTINSFSELTDSTRLAVQPFKVELVKVDREMTIAEFNGQHPSTIPVERVAAINGFDTPSDRIPAGITVKRVIGGQGATLQKKPAPADSTSGK